MERCVAQDDDVQQGEITCRCEKALRRRIDSKVVDQVGLGQATMSRHSQASPLGTGFCSVHRGEDRKTRWEPR